MSTYEQLFPSMSKEEFGDYIKDPNNAGRYPLVEDNPMVMALCALVDATREQTAEFRNLRIALTGGDQKSIDLAMPGRVEYPRCDACNCWHHPEDDRCINRGGPGATDITTMRRPAESQDEDFAATFSDPQYTPPPMDAAGYAQYLKERGIEPAAAPADPGAPIRQSPGGMSREEYFASLEKTEIIPEPTTMHDLNLSPFQEPQS